MTIGVIIPVYNVGNNLGSVLLQTLEYVPKKNVFVIDDGSTDDCAVVASQMNIKVYKHQKNLGKGEALKSGFRLAVDAGWESVITLDGDGQHDPKFIPDFIMAAQKFKYDILIGLRSFRIGEMPFDRICSNRVSSLMASITAGRWIRDSQCGYRLIKTEVLKNVSLITGHYELETELLIKAVRAGYQIGYCPISLIYNNANSHIRRMRDMTRFCILIFMSFGKKFNNKK